MQTSLPKTPYLLPLDESTAIVAAVAVRVVARIAEKRILRFTSSIRTKGDLGTGLLSFSVVKWSAHVSEEEGMVA